MEGRREGGREVGREGGSEGREGGREGRREGVYLNSVFCVQTLQLSCSRVQI